MVVFLAVTALRQFRIVALLEGWSYLALLFIAMPLKYAADLPLAVRVAGSVHGLLFLVFIATLFRATLERRWPIRRAVRGLLCSLIPFGAFVFDRSLRREMATRAEGPAPRRVIEGTP
jgi:integral membrane protein